jgi:hypothetical protein
MGAWQSGSTYWCIKMTWLHGGALTGSERFLIGDPPKARPSALSYVLAAEARRNEREWARIQGVRWLIDVGQDERLEVVT